MLLGHTGRAGGFSYSADTKCLLWGMLESELDGLNGLLPPLTIKANWPEGWCPPLIPPLGSQRQVDL